MRRRLRELERRTKAAEAEAERERLKQLMLQNDLTQRYIIIDGCTQVLTPLLGAAKTEELIRGMVPAPFVRTLGPLEPIFRAMLKAEEKLNALPPATRAALSEKK